MPVMEDQKPPTQFLTPEYVASYLNIELPKLRSMLRRKEIKGVKVGREWRIRPEELERFIRENSR